MSVTDSKTAIVAVAGVAYTGSFTKLYATGSMTLSSVSFGQMADPITDGTYHDHNGEIHVTAGTYLEGPIVKFFIKAASPGCIAYKR